MVINAAFPLMNANRFLLLFVDITCVFININNFLLYVVTECISLCSHICLCTLVFLSLYLYLSPSVCQKLCNEICECDNSISARREHSKTFQCKPQGNTA